MIPLICAYDCNCIIFIKGDHDLIDSHMPFFIIYTQNKVIWRVMLQNWIISMTETKMIGNKQCIQNNKMVSYVLVIGYKMTNLITNYKALSLSPRISK